MKAPSSSVALALVVLVGACPRPLGGVWPITIQASNQRPVVRFWLISLGQWDTEHAERILMPGQPTAGYADYTLPRTMYVPSYAYKLVWECPGGQRDVREIRPYLDSSKVYTVSCP